MILTASPYRVSLFGGGTDHPEWFEDNEGAVLGFAIKHYCYVGLKILPPVYDFKYRIVYQKVEDRKTVDEIEHPAVRGCLKCMKIKEDIELSHMGDLPARAGLGASSSFVVSLLLALHELKLPGVPLEDRALASSAIHVERDVIREAVGYQDQIFAAMGGLRFVAFGPGKQWSSERLFLRDYRRREFEASIVLVYTGSLRDTFEMAARQVAWIPQNTTHLRDLTSIAYEAKKILTDQDHSPISRLGDLLNDAWKVKRKLCPDITSARIDALYEHGLECGALGGKLLGAGGGGFIGFWVPPPRMADFKKRIGHPCVDVAISDGGARVVIAKEN